MDSELFVTVLFSANLLDYTVDDKNGELIDGSMTDSVKFAEKWTWAKKMGEMNWLLEGVEVVSGGAYVRAQEKNTFAIEDFVNTERNGLACYLAVRLLCNNSGSFTLRSGVVVAGFCTPVQQVPSNEIQSMPVGPKYSTGVLV